MSSSVQYLDEDNSYKFVFSLTNSETGAKIALASISSVQCTEFYYNPNLLTSDRNHLATINSRYNQNVKNANDVTITSSGTISWVVQPEDTVFLNSSNANAEEELHIALFMWTYGTGGSKQNSHTFFNYVRHVPYISSM